MVIDALKDAADLALIQAPAKLEPSLLGGFSRAPLRALYGQDLPEISGDPFFLPFSRRLWTRCQARNAFDPWPV
jgi:hypothetical protein